LLRTWESIVIGVIIN